MTLPPSWGTPKKLQARLDSVITPWRELTGLHALPEGHQYWTLCGNLTSEHLPEQLDPGCELRQMQNVGLITSNQFHGVEQQPAVQAANALAVLHEYPNPATRPHLYTGDIVRVFDTASKQKDFHPAIVNVDTPASPKFGFNLLAGVLSVLNCLDYPVMVIWNVVVEDRLKGKYRNNWSQVEHYREHEFLFHTLKSGNWEGLGQHGYDGTSAKSVSKMMSFAFYPRLKEAA